MVVCNVIHLSTETLKHSFGKHFLSEWGYFPAVGVMSQRTWEGCRPRKPSWWMPCHLCAASEDTCPILLLRHLLTGRMRFHATAEQYMCSWRDLNKLKLKEKWRGERVSHGKGRKMNQHDRKQKRDLYAAQNQIAKNVKYMRYLWKLESEIPNIPKTSCRFSMRAENEVFNWKQFSLLSSSSGSAN